MNLGNIISEIEKADPEVYEKLDTRRNAMKSFARVSGKVALASLPLALGAMFQKAYAAPNDAVQDVLNFALTLEYLEAQFYANVVASPAYSGISSAAQGALSKIAADEAAHVNFLKGVLGPAAVPQPAFDFTGGSGSGNGPFMGYENNYAVILAMAQTFEDTGVRAYKGQAPNLMSGNETLTAALQIHSVEARHASHIRQMRRALGTAVPAGVDLKPWIYQNQSAIDSPFNTYVQASYDGEENITQAGVDTTSVGGMSFSVNSASGAFDEPLTKDQVLAIAAPFLA